MMRSFVAICFLQALLVAYASADLHRQGSFGHNQYATGYGVQIRQPSFVTYIKEKFHGLKLTDSASDSSDVAKIIREFSGYSNGVYLSEILQDQTLCYYVAKQTDYYKHYQNFEMSTFNAHVTSLFSTHSHNRGSIDRKARRKLAVAILNISNNYESVYRESSTHIGAAGNMFMTRKVRSNSDCSNSSEEGKYVADLFTQNDGQYFNQFMQDRNCRQIIAQRVGYQQEINDQAFVEYVRQNYKTKGFRHKIASGLKQFTKKVTSPFGFGSKPSYVGSLDGFKTVVSLSNDGSASDRQNFELCNGFFQQETQVQELLQNRQVAYYLAQEVGYQNWQNTAEFQSYLMSGGYRENHGARKMAVALKHVNRSATSGRSLNYSRHKSETYTKTVTTTETHTSSSSAHQGGFAHGGHAAGGFAAQQASSVEQHVSESSSSSSSSSFEQAGNSFEGGHIVA